MKKWNNAINCREKFKLSSKQKIQTQPGKIPNYLYSETAFEIYEFF